MNRYQSLLLFASFGALILPSYAQENRQTPWRPTYTSVPENSPGLFLAADAEFYPLSFIPTLTAIKSVGAIALTGFVGIFIVVFIFQVITRALSVTRNVIDPREFDVEKMSSTMDLVISALEKYNELNTEN